MYIMYNVLLKFKYYYFDFMISNPNYPGKIISVLFASIPQIYRGRSCQTSVLINSYKPKKSNETEEMKLINWECGQWIKTEFLIVIAIRNFLRLQLVMHQPQNCLNTCITASYNTQCIQ